jgi:hypothetical protein
MLLKIILFALVAYFIFKKIASILLLMMGRAPKNHGFQQPRPRKEGEIRIDYAPDKGKKSSKKDFTDGEYIDFEEVE